MKSLTKKIKLLFDLRYIYQFARFRVVGSSFHSTILTRIMFSFVMFGIWHSLMTIYMVSNSCVLNRFTFKVVVEMREETPMTILECFSEPRPNKKMAADHAAEGALWYLRHVGCLLSKPSWFIETTKAHTHHLVLALCL